MVALKPAIKTIKPIVTGKTSTAKYGKAKLEFSSSGLSTCAEIPIIAGTKEKNKYFGRDEYFNSVIVESKENLVNKIKKIKITKINQNTLFGEINSKLVHKDFAA